MVDLWCGRMGGHACVWSSDYQFFSDGSITSFSYPWCYAAHASFTRAPLRNKQLEFAEYCRVFNPSSRLQNRKQMQFSFKKLDSRKQTFAAQPRAHGLFWKPGGHVMDTWSCLKERNWPLTGKSVLPPLFPLRYSWFYFWRFVLRRFKRSFNCFMHFIGKISFIKITQSRFR